MLCDNALLSYAYLEAYAQTGTEYYREVARRTLDYALEELRLPGGGFACAQDADSGEKTGAEKYRMPDNSPPAERKGNLACEIFFFPGKNRC